MNHLEAFAPKSRKLRMEVVHTKMEVVLKDDLAKFEGCKMKVVLKDGSGFLKDESGSRPVFYWYYRVLTGIPKCIFCIFLGYFLHISCIFL